jgi:non-specific serine/threonine protein kinase
VRIGRGQSSREIADALVISERTVETHIGNILAKLGYNARTQIAVWASEKGLLKQDE